VFRIAHSFPLGRWIFGQDYSYRASEVTIELLPGLRHDWIEIDGPPRTGALIQIGSRDRNPEIWSVCHNSVAANVCHKPRLRDRRATCRRVRPHSAP
jgi:hypothetical protein